MESDTSSTIGRQLLQSTPDYELAKALGLKKIYDVYFFAVEFGNLDNNDVVLPQMEVERLFQKNKEASLIIKELECDRRCSVDSTGIRFFDLATMSYKRGQAYRVNAWRKSKKQKLLESQNSNTKQTQVL